MSYLCVVYVLSICYLCVIYVLSMCCLCVVYFLSMSCLCLVYVLSMSCLCLFYVLSMPCLFLVYYVRRRYFKEFSQPRNIRDMKEKFKNICLIVYLGSWGKTLMWGQHHFLSAGSSFTTSTETCRTSCILETLLSTLQQDKWAFNASKLFFFVEFK